MPPRRFFVSRAKKSYDVNTDNKEWLVIVESPSKCAKIESFLGSKYCCVASKGHIRYIKGLKSIQKSKNYEIKFDILKDKTAEVELLKTIVKKFAKDKILLATDDDREGEAIAWHICQICDLDTSNTKRIIFHEITKEALLKSVAKPRTIDLDLVYAQHARQVLDLLVGYRISPLLWKQIGNTEKSLSAGRCQTPALRLVYENEKERSTDITTLPYKIMGKFTEKLLPFALYEKSEIADFSEKEVKEFMKESMSYQYVLSISNAKQGKKDPPKPFNTSRLLQCASNELGMSPAETMSNCQTLYQGGWISYMRTDSQKYSKEFLEEADSYIKEQWSENFVGELKSIQNENSNDPHEAIRVTHIEQTVGGEEGRARSLYKLIWRNTVQSCMSQMRLETISLAISSPVVKKKKELCYKYDIEIPIHLGWKIIGSEKTLETLQSEGRSLLFYMQSCTNIVAKEISATVIMKRNHSHYTEASLVQKLEDLGIGRPSTFSSLVETIQDRGYVKRQDLPGEKKSVNEYTLFAPTPTNPSHQLIKEAREKTFGAEKNKLIIQPVGELVINFLSENFDALFSYDYTKNMELGLDEVAKGEKEWHMICDSCDKSITEWMAPISSILKTVYKLSDTDEWVLKFCKNGPVLVSVDDKDSSDSSDSEIEEEKDTEKYKSVKPGLILDKEKLAKGEYTFDELSAIESSQDDLGEYEGAKLYLKNNKYGPYIEWTPSGQEKKTASLKGIDKEISKICRQDILEFLKKKSEKTDANMIRELTSELSIRKGKYGAYIFYKTPSMAKPKFFNIQKFPLSYTTCDPAVLIQWIKTTYNI